MAIAYAKQVEMITFCFPEAPRLNPLGPKTPIGV